jgi:trigger factor
VKTSVESLEGNKVKLSVEVDENEFESDLDAAFRRISREVRIPGFRPGKAPRRILEARLGPEVAREEALRHAVPEYYAKAVRDHDVDVIAAPEIDITGGEDEGPVAFDAVVEIRPEISVGGYDSLRVTIPSPEVTEADVDEQIDRIREQYADLRAVDRPAIDDDQVRIDIRGTQDGEPVSGLTAEDYVYPVGSGSVVPELDQNLRGAKPGDILEFEAEHPEPDQSPVLFRILVKEVNERVLPEPTDEWAAEASEFDTYDELRRDVTKRSRMVAKVRGQMAVRERVADALADLVAEELPEALINSEMQARLQDLAMRLQAQNMPLEQYLAASGRTTDDLQNELREAADQAVRVDLGLRSVAALEDIEATDDEVDAEIDQLAARVEQKPERVRKQLEEGEQLPELRNDIRKRKALDWLIDHVEVVDEEGHEIDSGDLVVEDDDAASVEEPEPTGSAEADAVDEPEAEGVAPTDTAGDGATEPTSESVTASTEPAEEGDQ